MNLFWIRWIYRCCSLYKSGQSAYKILTITLEVLPLKHAAATAVVVERETNLAERIVKHAFRLYTQTKKTSVSASEKEQEN